MRDRPGWYWVRGRGSGRGQARMVLVSGSVPYPNDTHGGQYRKLWTFAVLTANTWNKVRVRGRGRRRPSFLMCSHSPHPAQPSLRVELSE